MKKIGILVMFFLFVTAAKSHSVDPSILVGTWQSTVEGPKIVLIIDKNQKDATLYINNRKMNNVLFSYCYCQPSIYPFASIFGEETTEEHYIYFVIGKTRGKNEDFSVLRGFYEMSIIDSKKEIREVIKTLPIELRLKSERSELLK